ncbi:hypothetical protein [Conexibacter sp. SYSU D00693]|uniref:hypothetical protein n=1 Tax=Conexibacter sp. SYSU D00693 TaxID=2812560 RepID=UPI00196AFD38|nr:hypothetical protein [Conexibacter sp. SYSU D00693]
MLHVKLHDRRTIDAETDPMGRTWVGYDPEESLDVLFDQNRGRWVLGKRADLERYAVFSYTGDHTVKFVAEIDGYETSEDKRVIVGRVLGSDHPVVRRWVGAPAPDSFRNPVTYFDDPATGARECACGCGETAAAGRAFVPGHDQRAVHARISEQWGDTLGFIRWYDATYRAA